MQLFNVTGICLSFFVNYGISLDIPSPTDATKWRVPFALQMLPGAFLLVGMLFMNESPRWLVRRTSSAKPPKLWPTSAARASRTLRWCRS